MFGERAGLRDPITVHNFYVPAGGDIPDPALNPKFAHKLAFLDEMREAAILRPAKSERAILVGDLNVAPLEHDVWSHKQMLRVVSHTPIEVEKLNAARNAGGWIDSMRELTPEPQKLYTWWSYRAAELGSRRPRPPPRSRLDLAAARRPGRQDRHRQELSRRRASLRPRAGDGDDRGLRPRYCGPVPRASAARTFSMSLAHCSARATITSRNRCAASG